MRMESPASEYATLIEKIFSDQQGYRDLVVSSRLEYENRLNWKHWADKTFEVINGIE